MINFRDEILNTTGQIDGSPRYTIRDNNGNVLFDNVKFDLKTPVVQEGTALNKALLDSIKGDVYTADRYNELTYSGNTMSLNVPLDGYTVGKVVNIVAPNNIDTPYLNINNLGSKQINGKVEANKKYTLIYNGTSWDIVGVDAVYGEFVAGGSLRNISLGFKPQLVIVYTHSNNLGTIAGSSTNTPNNNQIPRILTQSYLGEYGQINDDGFSYRATGGTDVICYYIAIR